VPGRTSLLKAKDQVIGSSGRYPFDGGPGTGIRLPGELFTSAFTDGGPGFLGTDRALNFPKVSSLAPAVLVSFVSPVGV